MSTTAESSAVPAILTGNLPRQAGTRVEYVDVHRVYGTTHALDGLSLTIEPGELVALLGPSGCGKTTALRLLAGFDQPTSGQVLVDGKDISRTAVSKRDMGMVFQSYSLFPTMTATDNVAFGLRMRGEGGSSRRQRASELLELVGLGEHTAKYPHQMSGGQQQRVALARALAVRPRVPPPRGPALGARRGGASSCARRSAGSSSSSASRPCSSPTTRRRHSPWP